MVNAKCVEEQNLFGRGHLAIDPGLRGCGAALADGPRIVAAKYVVGAKDTSVVEGKAWEAMISAVLSWERLVNSTCHCSLVVELPQIYRASHQTRAKDRTDPNDLIELAAVVGGIVGKLAYPHVVVYRPAEWKGQVPKEIMHERARARLSQEELMVVNAGLPKQAGLAHNVWDAVAMLLVYLKRL